MASTSPSPSVRIGSMEDAIASRLWWRRKRKRRWAAVRAINERRAQGLKRRQLVGTFGALTVSLPRVRLLDAGEKEWRSQTIQAYKRLKTGRGDYRQYVPCRHQHAPCPPSAGRPVRGQGRQGRGEPRLAQGKDRLGELAGSGLVGRDIVRLILDGTGVKARLTSAVNPDVLGVRRDGQKVLLAVKNMGGETDWRQGGPSRPWPEGAGASDRRRRQGPGGGAGHLWSDIPVQRCTVHGANLLAHARLQIKADYTDMMYAENAEQVRKFLAKWRLRCRGVADSLKRRGSGCSPSCAIRRSNGSPWDRHRTPARGIQAPGEDPMRTTQRGNGGHAVLGLDGLGADHHAPRRWLANTRPSAGQEAD